MQSYSARKNQEIIRLQAIKLFLSGVKTPIIASQLEVQTQSVYLWIRLFKKKSWDGLRAKPHKGRPNRSAQNQLEQIRLYFANQPNTQDANPKLWTGPEILQILNSNWQITMNPKYIYRWLRRNQMETILAHKSRKLVDL